MEVCTAQRKACLSAQQEVQLSNGGHIAVGAEGTALLLRHDSCLCMVMSSLITFYKCNEGCQDLQ